MSWATDRQPYEPASGDLSRMDCEGMSDSSALYSLEKFNETTYLRFTSDRDKDELVINSFRKTLQFTGG